MDNSLAVYRLPQHWVGGIAGMERPARYVANRSSPLEHYRGRWHGIALPRRIRNCIARRACTHRCGTGISIVLEVACLPVRALVRRYSINFLIEPSPLKGVLSEPRTAVLLESLMDRLDRAWRVRIKRSTTRILCICASVSCSCLWRLPALR